MPFRGIMTTEQKQFSYKHLVFIFAHTYVAILCSDSLNNYTHPYVESSTESSKDSMLYPLSPVLSTFEPPSANSNGMCHDQYSLILYVRLYIYTDEANEDTPLELSTLDTPSKEPTISPIHSPELPSTNENGMYQYSYLFAMYTNTYTDEVKEDTPLELFTLDIPSNESTISAIHSPLYEIPPTNENGMYAHNYRNTSLH